MRQTSGCEGWNFKIWDGFRTLRTQKLLYDNYLRDLERKHPDWSDKQLDKAVRIFVSYPSRDPDLPPPHNTGGAVDLTLVAMDGEEIPMGTEFDEFNVRAFTDHFVDGDDDISEIDEIDVPYSVDQCKLFHENRTLLKEILAKVGFVNYREEWWHFSYGDREWARQTGENFAVYGGMGEARVLFGK